MNGCLKDWRSCQGKIGSSSRIIREIQQSGKRHLDYRHEDQKADKDALPVRERQQEAYRTCRGVAASAKYIWIASGKSVYQIPVSTVSGKKDYSNVVMKKIRSWRKASYAAYSDGALWVGEYMDGQDIGQSMCKPGPQGKARGYKLNGKGELPANPKATYTWTTPDRVQGMALTKNRVFTVNPAAATMTAPCSYIRGEPRATGQLLENASDVRRHLSEGSSLYVLFESGARKYADRKYPLKNMYIINTKKLKL